VAEVIRISAAVLANDVMGGRYLTAGSISARICTIPVDPPSDGETEVWNRASGVWLAGSVLALVQGFKFPDDMRGDPEGRN
jgi:hypothetical protein